MWRKSGFFTGHYVIPKSLCTHTSCGASWGDLRQYPLCSGFYTCSRIHTVRKNCTAKPLFSHWAALSPGDPPPLQRDFLSSPWTFLSFQDQKALIESLQNWPLSIHNNQDLERLKGVGLREKIKQSQLLGSPGNPAAPGGLYQFHVCLAS